jgi:hypothetical protein
LLREEGPGSKKGKLKFFPWVAFWYKHREIFIQRKFRDQFHHNISYHYLFFVFVANDWLPPPPTFLSYGSKACVWRTPKRTLEFLYVIISRRLKLKGRFANLWLAAASPDSPLPAESRQQEGGSRDQIDGRKDRHRHEKVIYKSLLKRWNSLGRGGGMKGIRENEIKDNGDIERWEEGQKGREIGEKDGKSERKWM